MPFNSQVYYLNRLANFARTFLAVFGFPSFPAIREDHHAPGGFIMQFAEIVCAISSSTRRKCPDSRRPFCSRSRNARSSGPVQSPAPYGRKWPRIKPARSAAINKAWKANHHSPMVSRSAFSGTPHQGLALRSSAATRPYTHCVSRIMSARRFARFLRESRRQLDL